MTSYETITSLIGFDNHSNKVKELFNQHFSETELTFTFEDVQEVVSYIPVSDNIKQAIINQYETVSSNQEILDGLSFIQLITVGKAHPSEWLMNKEPIYSGKEIPSGVFSLYSLLVIAIHQIRIYKENNIDEKHIAFNLQHLQGYISSYYEKNQMIGVDNYTWCIYLASLGLIHLHTLHFMHHVFSEPCIVLRNKKTSEVTMLALDGIDVRYDGQINKVNGINNYSFTTMYKETKTSYIGHRVNPYGAITNDVMICSKMDYDVILKQGDYVIDFHIPTGPGYTVENTKESFTQAKVFFERVYKEYDYKAFWCLSWLSSPQIPFFIMKPVSNIYQINEESYTFPATNDQSSILKFVFGDEKVNLDLIIPSTSLEKGIIKYTKTDNKINCGVFLFFMDDLPKFGSTIYRSDKDYHEFKNLNITKNNSGQQN